MRWWWLESPFQRGHPICSDNRHAERQGGCLAAVLVLMSTEFQRTAAQSPVTLSGRGTLDHVSEQRPSPGQYSPISQTGIWFPVHGQSGRFLRLRRRHAVASDVEVAASSSKRKAHEADAALSPAGSPSRRIRPVEASPCRDRVHPFAEIALRCAGKRSSRDIR